MNDQLIKELEFILTHPSCSVDNVETFYQTCLFIYDEVPLFIIVDYMRKTKPRLLREWSARNLVVQKIINEMEIGTDELTNREINIRVDLSGVTPTRAGIYRIEWRTELDEIDVTEYFKGKSIKVIDMKFGEVDLIGYSKVANRNHYNLYLKIKEELT